MKSELRPLPVDDHEPQSLFEFADACRGDGRAFQVEPSEFPQVFQVLDTVVSHAGPAQIQIAQSEGAPAEMFQSGVVDRRAAEIKRL